MHVGMLYSRIRKDEKLLLSELRDRGHDVTKVDVRSERFNIARAPAVFDDVDIVLDRCLSTSRSLYVTRFVDAYGIPVVNRPETAELCADKVKNSLVLQGAGIPTPATEVAFTMESALETIEEFNAACDPGEFDPHDLDGNATTGIEPPKTNWALPIDEPPYYGFPTTGGITFTFGGLQINSDAEVLDTGFDPIPGLYAAGNSTGELFYYNYPGGSGQINAAVYGRIAGQNAASYVKSD